MDTTTLEQAMADVDFAKVGERMRATRDAFNGVAKAASAFTAAMPRSTTLPMLAALQMRGNPIYAGTADPVEVAKRRAGNKVARAQRRVNRQRNFRKGVR